MLHCPIRCVVCGTGSNPFGQHEGGPRVYHEIAGLAKPRSTRINTLREECAAKRLGRRELVGRIEVHPIRGCGAIEIGVHRFFVRTPNGERPGSTAKFTHVWNYVKNKAIRMTRIDGSVVAEDVDGRATQLARKK